MNSQIKAVFDYLNSPQFEENFQKKLERDRQAAREWRHTLVTLANNQVAPNEEQLALQQRFLAAELDHTTMWEMICDLSDKAGVKHPEPTPHDMGLD